METCKMCGGKYAFLQGYKHRCEGEVPEIDFTAVNAGDTIEYIGNSFFAWEDTEYKCTPIEETYLDPTKVPEQDKGKWVIIELTPNDNALFFTAERLNPKEWRKKNE